MVANKTIEDQLSRSGLSGIDELLEFPKYVQIETVSLCNARCIMCPVEDWIRDVSIMEDALFEKIAYECKEYADWIERITIQLDGEPLIDKKLEKRIRTLKSIGIRFVAFATNGSLMTARRARTILESGVDEVSFSIDGATKETFEKIRVRLNFEKVVANILSFLNVRDELEAKTIVRVRMTVQRENQHEMDEFLSFWRSRLGPRDSVYAKVLHTWGNSENDYNLADGYSFARLNDTPCSSPWTSLVILTDGRVPLCCCDYNAAINSGNVKERSIKELWQGATLTGVRKLHGLRGRKSMPMCINCTVWADDAKTGSDH